MMTKILPTNSHWGPWAKHLENMVLHEQRKWSLHGMQHDVDARNAYALMTREQKEVFDAIIEAVLTYTPSQIFVDSKAGTGKMFLVNAICSKLDPM